MDDLLKKLIQSAKDVVSKAVEEKTCTPEVPGPIPIPYPKFGRSSDTANGSKKVKTNGKQLMLKGNKFSTSSGDEEGTKKRLRKVK